MEVTSFNEDVAIVDHALVLQDATGAELARLSNEGNLVIRREALGSLVDVLSFVGKTGELTLGEAVDGGRLAVLAPVGETIALRGGDATAVVGVTGAEGHVKVRDTDGVDVFPLDGGPPRFTSARRGATVTWSLRTARGALPSGSTAGPPTVRTEVTDRMLIFAEQHFDGCLPGTPRTTTSRGRIGRCGCGRRARYRRFPSQFRAGSAVDRSWVDSSTSTRRLPEAAGQAL